MASGVNVPFALGSHGAPQREQPSFPGSVEYRLVFLVFNGTNKLQRISMGRRFDQNPWNRLLLKDDSVLRESSDLYANRPGT